MVKWDQLTAEKFEKFCCAILYKNNFTNIRKMGDAYDRDRGRDLLANKINKPLSQIEKEERWIIQCKRWFTTKLTIKIIEDELKWTKAHKPDGIMFFTTQRMTSDTIDWFEKIKDDYKFQIIIVDVDYLENEISKDAQLKKRFFKSKDKVDSYFYDHIVGPRTHDLMIYTAGIMPEEPIRGAISKWRKELEKKVKINKLDVGFYHPEFFGCDHSGIDAENTVSMDTYMIQKSDAIIAYLNKEELYGTTTEIMIANTYDKKIGIFIDENILYKIDESKEGLEDYINVYNKVFKTKHRCACTFGLEPRDPYMRNVYWFILFYISMINNAASIEIVNSSNYSEKMVTLMKKWKYNLPI